MPKYRIKVNKFGIKNIGGKQTDRVRLPGIKSLSQKKMYLCKQKNAIMRHIR